MKFESVLYIQILRCSVGSLVRRPRRTPPRSPRTRLDFEYIKQILALSLVLAVSAAMTSGCSSFLRDEVSGVPIDPRVRAEQEGEIAKGDAAMQVGDYQTAEKLYSEFQKRFPTSIFYQRAQLGLAQALDAQERWAEAADFYRKTIEVTRGTQPEIAALALYKISFSYENLGDEARVLASLQDALQMKEHLLPEQIMAEIPARMAASYNRMGRTKEAQAYLRQAESGIQQVRATYDANQAATWLSRTYLNMGAFSTNQLYWENLQASLDTLKMVQIFSFRSAEAGGAPWSKMASQGLIANYRDLWNTIQQIPLNKAMDMGAAKREQTDRQVDLTGQLLTLITELKQYRTPERGEESPEASELFLYLEKLEKQAQEFLLSVGNQNPLTPEAQKRGGLKR